MKCAILYSTLKPDFSFADYSQVHVPANRPVFVRAETGEYHNLTHALKHANPLPGETVLNAISLEVE